MNNKLIMSIVTCFIIFSFILASCSNKTVTTSSTKSATPQTTVMTATSTQVSTTQLSSTTAKANWWDKFGEPQYGGTIIYRTRDAAGGFDNINFMLAAYQLWMEQLWSIDWTVDRSTFSFQTSFVPSDYMKGNLAESWDMPDAQTITIKLREGIKWQDKAPVNGREFTAYDVQEHYDRILGTGSGYTTPAPMYVGTTSNFDRVTAIDRYTVQFKFKSPGSVLLSAQELFGSNMIEAPESVKAQGGLTDLNNAAGTGPWIPTEYIDSSSLTCIKNANYWQYDELHSGNKLPYADTVKILFITDSSTAQAALRTGKIDVMNMVDWQSTNSLLKSNPELQKVSVKGSGNSLLLRTDKEPFTDIKVRKALQLSVNLADIASGFYGGSVDSTPVGLVSTLFTGYYYSYSQWSQELKDEYSYNPTKAKELLSEAGYSNGFKTNILANTSADIQLLQVMKAYFSDIGVDMEIKTMDTPTWAAYLDAGKQDQMCYFPQTAVTNPPSNIINTYRSTNTATNRTHTSDAGWDSLAAKFDKATEVSELGAILMEADKYALEQHWVVNTLPQTTYSFYQPYLKGYSGEELGWSMGYVLARCWVEQESQK